MWLLKSAKDQILGVDTPRQQVPPRIRYGTACLLIRDVIGCGPCSVAWGKTQDVTWIHKVQEGTKVRGNLSSTSGTRGQGKL
jgi:hypothetical protein